MIGRMAGRMAVFQKPKNRQKEAVFFFFFFFRFEPFFRFPGRFERISGFSGSRRRQRAKSKKAKVLQPKEAARRAHGFCQV